MILKLIKIESRACDEMDDSNKLDTIQKQTELILKRTYNKSLDFKVFSEEQLETVEKGMLGSVYKLKLSDSTKIILTENTLERKTVTIYWNNSLFIFIKEKIRNQDMEAWGAENDDYCYEFCPLKEELSNYIDLIFKYKIYVDIDFINEKIYYLNKNKEEHKL